MWAAAASSSATVLRNSRTDDADLQRFDDCEHQRGLSPEGRQQAAALGLALRQAHCDIAEVVSSPLCRALATAELACGQAATPDPALAYLPYMRRDRRALAREHLRDWLSRPVAAGRVRVVIADAANLMDLTGTYPAECAPQAFVATGPGTFEPAGSLPAPPWSAVTQARSAES